MKKIYFLLLLFLAACNSDNFVQNEVSRSQIYYGQSLTDLQNNFGIPKKAERYAYDVIVYTFTQEEIIPHNSDKYLKYCDLRAYVQNNRVIDWDWKGNNCQFKEKEEQFTLFDDFFADFNDGEHEENLY